MQTQRKQPNIVLPSIVPKSSQQQLSELREGFREFAYRVSHDVNAPMRSVVNFSELLARKYEKTLLDNQARDYLAYIVKGVKQAQDMLDALLEYSRIDTLSNPTIESDCNLILERCLRLLHPLIERFEVTVRSEPLPFVLCEPKQLEKLFCVLIENAIQFRSSGRIPEVSIGAKSIQDAWLFWVADNGIGIAPKYHKEIFQAFRHVHTGVMQSGLGMGLAIAQKIIQRHKGEIWVVSDSDLGSVFYFTLPADDKILKEEDI